MPRVSVGDKSSWELRATAGAQRGRARRRTGAAPEASSSTVVELLLSDPQQRFSLVESIEAQSTAAARRGAVPASFDFTIEEAGEASYVFVQRHASGAIEFHAPEDTPSVRRGARRTQSARVQFRIPIRVSSGQRRGLIGNFVKGVVLKVVDRLAEKAIQKLAHRFESSRIEERWYRVSKQSLVSGELVQASAAQLNANGRALLFIHGTFSSTVGGFRGLADTDFFERVQSVYGDRLFGFNHFTLSRTPEENARALLTALPNTTGLTFDVITHSRGGLVLRQLIERADVFGDLGKRFKLGHAVLVACPNEGTPLATGGRWDQTFGWLANLMDLFPENPFTVGTQWVAEAVTWLANKISGSLPGLHAMDRNSEAVQRLQDAPAPPANAYSALAANFEADGNVLARLGDLGLDAFFATANDLVVPTAGSWHTDQSNMGYVPAARIGCYGPGGNIDADGVHHMNFFARPDCADFLVRALRGEAQPLPAMDSASAFVEGTRRGRSLGTSAAAQPALAPTKTAAVPAVSSVAPGHGFQFTERDVFQLMILPPPATVKGKAHAQEKPPAKLLAMYGTARVLVDFYTSGTQDGAGQRWHQLITYQRRMRNYIDGIGTDTLPSDAELIEYGTLLFQTLLPGEVRRLYDTARSLQNSTRLNVIFTSMVNWVADLPWEFAYDPSRKSFLATEDVHFVRNVLTAVPAEAVQPRTGPLRILVVSAQPVGAARLSIEEETTVIRRGFEPLIETGLVSVDVLPQATPSTMHGWISTGSYDVVHFIGHGDFDFETGKGSLVFETERGGLHELDDRSLREILCRRGIRLVFLNACESGRGGRQEFNHGVAPALVAGGLPAVVANQFKVLDSSATTFAQHFYWSLAQGLPLGTAAREARISVNYSLSGEAIDWAVPVLYARDPDMQLCAAAATRQVILPQTTASARRATRAHAQRVALWDVDHVFPGLDEIAQTLNRAQAVFGFELVDLTVPVGTWRRAKAKAGSTFAHLQAEEIAKKLRNTPQELGVDYLLCITNQWMSGAGWDNLYGWASDKIDVPVLMFSVAGLDLAPRAQETSRALANMIVSLLAFRLGGAGAHDRQPKRCPMFSNIERELAVVTGHQVFDKRCAQLLQKKIPREFDALNRLLNAIA
jgi:hypothetical protein